MQNYQAAGFSKRSLDLRQPLEDPQQTFYDGRWLSFAHWAAGQGIDPLGRTAAQIATFCIISLILVAYHLKLSKVQVLLSLTSNAAVVQAKTTFISDMFTSMDLKRPGMTPVLP